jgi:hypothetical protein
VVCELTAPQPARPLLAAASTFPLEVLIMCFGSRPSPPQVVYQGPSEEEMAADRAAIESYRQASLQQQQQFADQLQQQIDRANAQMEEQRGRLQSEQQAAMAQAAAQQQGS